MDTKQKNLGVGLAFFFVGLALLFVLGRPWYVGLPITLLGAYRIYVALVNTSTGSDDAGGHQ